jgi:hypothetical protein
MSKLLSLGLLFLVYIPLFYFGFQQDANSVLSFFAYFIIGLYFLSSLVLFFVGTLIEKIMVRLLIAEQYDKIHEIREKSKVPSLSILAFALLTTYILFGNGHLYLAGLFLTAYLSNTYFFVKIDKISYIFSETIKLNGQDTLRKTYGENR